MGFTTPLHPETHAETAARLRALDRHIQTLADAPGIIGAGAAQDLRAELAWIADAVETDRFARPAYRTTSRP